VPSGFTTEVFADQDMLSHPVSIHVDHQSRVFVAETYDLDDIDWSYEDFDKQLACQTRADCDKLDQAMDDSDPWKPEVLRVLVDRDADGSADESTVFSDSFERYDGCASGVAVRGDKVWFGVSPNLWQFRDQDKDNVADQSKVLHHGFGVRQRLRGHDLNSLTFGPDGKLYFCIGDRGAHIETEHNTVSASDCGSVMRCNADGSDLELFATGLRNPQGLAFDNFGNLWTGDNDTNHGDDSRWLHIVEGGDYGWRIGFQLAENCGPWKTEDYCGQSDVPCRLPAAGFLVRSPSGLAFNPGTCLPAEYDDHFFLADYVDGLDAISNKQVGASYRMEKLETFIKLFGLTDVKFGPGGAMFVSDMVRPGAFEGQGRILKISHRESINSNLASETQTLLREGMKEKSNSGLSCWGIAINV
jgi:quinoprotein glucose dehydrogenase